MLLAGVSLGVLPGCVDKSFDLDNFDDTARLDVKDLTLPLEFTGAVTFKDVVGDLEAENDLVHVDANGNYVLIQGDDFESDEIYINPIVAAPDVAAFKNEPPLEVPVVANVPVDLTALNVGDHVIFPFNFDFDLVDNYIRDITFAKVESSIDFTVETGVNCTISDLSFAIPEGMNGYVESNFTSHFDYATGTITFDKVQISASAPFRFQFHVTELDVKRAGGKFTYGGNGEHGVFHLENRIKLVGGKLMATQSGKADLVASFSLQPIDIKTVSGSITYRLDDIDQAADIYDLLPEILRDPQTELALVDPQLYIEVENPFAKYGCSAHTNVTLKQSRDNANDYILSGDGPKSVISVTTARPVNIDAPADWTGETHTERFVFSNTDKPSFIYGEFSGAQPVKLPGLGYIIYGKGLPTSLDFIITDPVIDSNEVHDFPIGQSVGRVTGRYCFYAPLDFANGSQVVYTQEQTGWDITDLIITKFQIATTVTSSVPVDVILSAYPIVRDEKGNEVVDRSVKVTSTVIEANAKDKPVVIKMEGGEVRDLRGMQYTVTLKADGQGGSIGENIALDMEKVRVTVSGYYDFEDDDDDDDDDDDYDYEYYN